MSIVNCKVKHIRPKYNNNVYIARGWVVFFNTQRFPVFSSNFANPYKICKDSTHEEVIDKYRKYITQKLENNKSLQDELMMMKNKNLGCWCYPEMCHGNIILKLIDIYTKLNILYIYIDRNYSY
jgi:hypothetical protein